MQGFLTILSSLPRIRKVFVQGLVDFILVLICFFVAMALRLEDTGFVSAPVHWVSVPLVGILTVSVFYFMGLYRSLVRFVTGKILVVVGKGVLVSAILLYFMSLALDAGVPRSVPIIYGTILFLSVGGVRFVVRYLLRQPSQFARKPVIIFGAGEAGLQLLNSLFHGSEFAPFAFVDDDTALQRLTIGGLRVHAPSEIPRLVAQSGAKVILLAAPNMTRVRRREVVSLVEGLRLQIKTIPGMSEIIGGKAKMSELRAVTAEDLLGRDPVAPEAALMGMTIAGKSVMVSGAGGSIGSELCRQILQAGPATLVLYDISEFALYTVEAEMRELASRLNSKATIVAVLGSVLNRKRLEDVIRSFGINTIYHTAAYKHVPLVEENVIEGIENNVFGTFAIATTAATCGVERFILISTDKAVRPTNVMGASKRVAELICQALAQGNPATVFAMVRFGNVLGSSGSVIPRFRQQIERGGPVTVTHRDINRFFMTIPEAAQLVIQAGAMAKGGDVFVLDMGQPFKILELAFSMIKLHGLVPYIVEKMDQVDPDKGDIPVCITGLRKGEKLFEELLIGNDPVPTQHPRIMTASEVSLSLPEVTGFLTRLRQACDATDLPQIVALLREMPLEYGPTTEVVSDLIWNADSAGRTPSLQPVPLEGP